MGRLFGIVVACVGLVFMGAGTAAASPQGKRIAHLTTAIQHPFVAALSKALTARAKELGMEVTTFTTPFDAALQAQQLDDAIAQKYDMIALLAASEQAIIPPMTRAKRAGVPVMIVNSPPKEGAEDLYISFIGEDHLLLGRIIGETLLKGFAEGGRDGGKVALVTGSLHEGVAPFRVAGFKEALAKNPKVEIVATEDAKWDTATSERVAGQLIARFSPRGGIDAFYGMADNQAVAIIQALENAGLKPGVKKGEVLVVGSNCLKSGIEMIKAGKQYATGTQIPTRTGIRSAEAIADYFNGKTLPKKIVLPVEAVTRANVAQWEGPCTF
ncbi:MAG: sugar ABC transporter substrate-binding protein [Rhodospirillales bacterium]